jgi:dihydropteroate synthase
MTTTLHCGRFKLDVSENSRALVMGILNVTPDSFSDGGAFTDTSTALKHAQQMLREGADIIDIGAQSTRPGAQDMSAGEEWARLAVILPELMKLKVPISVDTYQPSTMKLAIEAGCDMINCVAGFRVPGAIDAVAKAQVALCVMHRQGEPRDMQTKPTYDNVTHEVATFLGNRAMALLDAGIKRERIVLDPGYGFGKTAAHNLTLLKQQRELCALAYPILVGLSRKNTLGLIVNRPAQERVAASVAAALYAVKQGARIVRVHDVAQTVDALKVWHAIETGTMP